MKKNIQGILLRSPPGRKKVNPDIHAGKSHSEKLKNDSSAARSYRGKIRYGKKDNSLSVSEAKRTSQYEKTGEKEDI